MDNSTTKLMFSSATNEWGTPQSFFDRLDKIFGFTLDPCANASNAKCSNFFTMEENGLKQDWSGHVVFCNPPYGRSLKHWVRKCYEEGCKSDTTVVMLVPSRTDTRYYHDYIMKARKVYFVKGRIKFENPDKTKNSAPFPSLVAVFDGPDQVPVFEAMVA